MGKILKIFFLTVVLLFLLSAGYFFIGKAPLVERVIFGVNFSQSHAQFLSLDWKETYLALFRELGVRRVKLLTNWNWVEGKQGEYYFDDVDWQVNEAEKREVQLIYVVGMKSGRWPECHVPDFAKTLSKKQQQEEILKYIEATITRYKGNNAIIAWQAENEPLFRFGECPWYDKKFLRKEVALIKSLDPTRPVIVSDSGEQSLWLGASSIGDIVGVTTYRKVWVHLTDRYGFYVTFPLPPIAYWRRAELVRILFDKKVIGVELQAEPWVRDVFADIPLEEQGKTMNVEQFKENIQYAKSTGLNEFYLWGAEWWYWMKEKQARPEIWDEAKKLFSESNS